MSSLVSGTCPLQHIPLYYMFLLIAKNFINRYHSWTTSPVSSRQTAFHPLKEKLEASLIFTADFKVESVQHQYLPSSSCTLKPQQVVLRLFRQVVFNSLRFIWCCWNGDCLFIKEYFDGIAHICNIQKFPQFAELKIKTFWYTSLHFCCLLMISMDMFLLFWK